MSQVLAACIAGFRFVLVYFSSWRFICCFAVKDFDLSETMKNCMKNVIYVHGVL